MKQVVLRIGSLRFTGHTKTEAESKRDAALEALTEDLGPPLIVDGPDQSVGIVFRTEHGWDYGIRRRGDRDYCTCSGNGNRLETEYSLRRHLAQNAYDDNSLLNQTDGAKYLHPDDHVGRSRHADWVQFQREYARLRAQGLPDAEAHYQASGGTPQQTT